jgi:hypothetical protein
MGQLTTYLKNKLADHVLKGTAYTAPSKVYIALHTADPTVVGNVAEVTTATYPGYARQQVTTGATSNGSGTNSADLTWNVNAPAGITFTHVTIWDAVTAGNPLFYGRLEKWDPAANSGQGGYVANPKTMANGDVFRIPAGSLSVGFD